MPKRALVVGVTGQDGAFLAKLLAGKGYEVMGTSRDAQVARLDNLQKLGVLSSVRVESMNPTDFRSTMEVLTRF
jgi:GDPmannose 4,6-dehydratase